MDETRHNAELAARLRDALAGPPPGSREVYGIFAPLDLTTGERRMQTPGSDYRRAAVLVPVLLAAEGPRIVYTLRTGGLRDHAGQVSFPGGGIEPGDESPLAAALREAGEEVDLRPGLVEVVGELEELYIPPSNFLVSPFVGLLPEEAALTLAPEEVEEIFSVSVEELMSPGSFETVVRERDGRPYEYPVFAVAGREIWGATAAMTAALLARLGWRLEQAAR